jgi:hypothetical protein
MRSRLLAISTIVLLLAGTLVMLLAPVAGADTWDPSISGGFSGSFAPAQPTAPAMAVYPQGSGQVYAGTRNEGTGCRVYHRTGGTNWSQVNTDGFGNIANTVVESMVVYNGDLYAGTRNETTGAQVWRYDGGNWTRAGLFGGFGDPNNVAVSSLAVYGGNLYAGTENDSSAGGSGCQVWQYTGLIWIQVNTSGFGFNNNRRVTSMTAYNGSLVAGTENTGTGCHVWRFNGSVWNAVTQSGFGSALNTAASSMIELSNGYGDKLCVGTYNQNAGCQLWTIDAGWATTQVSSGGFGTWSNHGITSMAVYSDPGTELFMGTKCEWSGSEGCEVWTWDGNPVSAPALSIGGGFGDALNQGAVSAVTGNGELFFGTLNDPTSNNTDMGTGTEIWRYSGGTWTQANVNGFTSDNNYMVSSMVNLNGDIYAGTAAANGCEVWQYDGDSWNGPLNIKGFGNQNNSMATSMAVYDDGGGGGPKLYVGTYNTAGSELWRYDNPGWTKVSSVADIEGNNNRSIASMTAFPAATPDKLVCGTYNNHGGCEVWTYDGAWTKLVGTGGTILAAGFGNGNNSRASSVVDVGANLYFGVLNYNTGAEAWRYTPGTPGTFEQSASNGFGNSHNQDACSMALFQGQVFAGTQNWDNGCAVVRHDPTGLTGWTQVNDYGFGDGEGMAWSMATSDNRLFVGTAYNCEVWASYTADSSGSWTQANTSGFTTPGNSVVSAMVSRAQGLGRSIFAGTQNTDYGAEVLVTAPSIDSVVPPIGVQGTTVELDINGSNTHFNPATSVVTFSPSDGLTINSTNFLSGTEVVVNVTISDLAPVGPRDVNVLTPGETPQALTAGFTVSLPGVASIASVAPRGAPQGTSATVSIVGNNTHFIDGQSIATFSGSGIKVNATHVTDVHHATADITIAQSAAAGSRNVNVTTVNEAPTPLANAFAVTYGAKQAWYLAEGCTANGFETWVLVQNPGPGGANVSLTYMTPNGAVAGPTAQLPPDTRRTFKVADTVPNQTDVSTMVTADAPVIAERSMYGNNRGWADDSLGIWTPAQSWYLAEGCTGPGFDTWILVQNPSSSQANVKLTFMTSHGPVDGPKLTMDANTRHSFKVNNSAPGEWQVSTQVTADQAVVAERAIYGNNQAWATESIGTSTPSQTWYLPEGSTGPGFETWVLVQNPGDKDATVKLTLMEPTGQVAGPTLKIAAQSRATVNLADTAPGQWSVSAMVTSDQPVIAERAMYGNNRQWAHDSIGSTGAYDTWCLAEGCTGPGFETWVLVQNPGDSEAHVGLTYMTPDGARTGPSVVLPAHSRRTFNVADSVPNVWEVSTKVTSDKPVVAERSVYSSTRIWGHDSIGCPW